MQSKNHLSLCLIRFIFYVSKTAILTIGEIAYECAHAKVLFAYIKTATKKKLNNNLLISLCLISK